MSIQRIAFAATAASIALFTFSQALAAEIRYFLEPLTAEAHIEASGSKSAIADNVRGRVRLVCGQKFVENEAEATARVRIHVADLKKVGGGSRFFLGPIRGNSHISLYVIMVDADGKELSRSRRLTRKGNGFLGTVTVGATDNKMLTNIAHDVCGSL